MDFDRLGLAETMTTIEGLILDSLRPSEVEGNDVICADEVQADTSSLLRRQDMSQCSP